MMPAAASCSTCSSDTESRATLLYQREIGAADPKGRHLLRLAAVGHVDAKRPLGHRMGGGVELDRADFAGGAAIHALEFRICDQGVLQLLPALDVAAFGQHPADDVPHRERILVDESGDESELEAKILDTG